MTLPVIPNRVCADCGGRLRWCKDPHLDSPWPQMIPHPIHLRPTDHDPRMVTIGNYYDAYVKTLAYDLAEDIGSSVLLLIRPEAQAAFGRKTPPEGLHDRGHREAQT